MNVPLATEIMRTPDFPALSMLTRIALSCVSCNQFAVSCVSQMLCMKAVHISSTKHAINGKLLPRTAAYCAHLAVSSVSPMLCMKAWRPGNRYMPAHAAVRTKYVCAGASACSYAADAASYQQGSCGNVRNLIVRIQHRCAGVSA